MRILPLTSTGHDNIQMLCAKIQERKNIFSSPFNSLAVDTVGLRIYHYFKIIKLHNSTGRLSHMYLLIHSAERGEDH